MGVKRAFWIAGQRMLFILLGAVLCIPPAALSQDVKWIKVGMLHSWFRSDGCEPEVGRTGLQSDQQDGLRWPALYPLQDNIAAKALWLGTSNYTDADQYGGVTYPFKVAHLGPRGWDIQREFIPIDFKMIGRFDHPQVFVDGTPGSDLMFNEALDDVDPTLPADRMIYNVVNTSIGVTMTRKIYAFSQQYNDNFFIYDYVFKNTGNVDKDPEIEKPNQTLNDFWVFFQYRYAVSREGADWTNLNSPRWGINEMLSTRGEATRADGDRYAGNYADWLNGNANADSMRVQFAWLGRHSQATYDLIGSPGVFNRTGRFGAPQFIGVITLHADKAPGDPNDDPLQPMTTTYQQSDDPPTRPNDQFDPVRMAEEWAWITRGHRLPRHDEVIGNGFPDLFEGTPGGFSNMNGYGPYTLAPGDSIHIVLAEGVNGLSRELCTTLGKQWFAAYDNPSGAYTFNLPGGGTTNDKDVFKNAWVMTGRDSLFKTLGRARRVYQANLQIPQPPPPPSIFEINSGGDRIRLSWSDDAESWPGFAGYKIYRSEAKFDTTFELLATLPPGQLTYDDTGAIRNFSYYYYVTTFTDGSNNHSPLNPGGPLESSLFWTRTFEPAFLRRPAVADMDSIRVVPNPFYIKARRQQYPEEPDKLAFLDIPGKCTIKIYTERGDLIKTILHEDGSGDESWDSTTEFGQVVVSGLYIAVIETPDGRQKVRKFVIIR